MTTLAVTNTLSNGAVILASEHNTNYSDIVTYVNNHNSGSATWDALSVSSASNVPMVLNNSTGTQDILRVQDNGSNVFVVADGGYITSVNQSACRVFRNTSDQVVGSGAETKIQFNGETYDVQSEFDSATNYRFTATVTGKYIVACVVRVTTVASGTSTLTLKINGSAVSASSVVTASGTIFSIFLSDIVALTATDYVELFYTQNTGSNVDVDSGTTLSYMGIHKVA